MSIQYTYIRSHLISMQSQNMREEAMPVLEHAPAALSLIPGHRGSNHPGDAKNDENHGK